jgi:hypothetical protein
MMYVVKQTTTELGMGRLQELTREINLDASMIKRLDREISVAVSEKASEEALRSLKNVKARYIEALEAHIVQLKQQSARLNTWSGLLRCCLGLD